MEQLGLRECGTFGFRLARGLAERVERLRDAVAALMERGMNLEQIQQARPIRAQAAAWGQDEAAERGFVATIHHGLSDR